MVVLDGQLERRSDRDMLKSADISAEQVRAARAFLDLSQEQLAEAAGITRKSLYELEHGSEVQSSTALAIRRTLEAQGVLFIEHGDKSGILASPEGK